MGLMAHNQFCRMTEYLEADAAFVATVKSAGVGTIGQDAIATAAARLEKAAAAVDAAGCPACDENEARVRRILSGA